MRDARSHGAVPPTPPPTAQQQQQPLVLVVLAVMMMLAVWLQYVGGASLSRDWRSYDNEQHVHERERERDTERHWRTRETPARASIIPRRDASTTTSRSPRESVRTAA